MKRYMKRFLAIAAVLMLALSMMCASVYAEADSHGADAHSPSMSVSSGEEPIPDMDTTREGGSGGPGLEYEDPEKTELDKKDIGELVESVIPDDLSIYTGDFEGSDEDGADEKVISGSNVVKYGLAGAAGICFLLVIVILFAVRNRSKKNDKDSGYRTKH